MRSLIGMILERRSYEVETFSGPGSCPLKIQSGCRCGADYACCDLIVSDLNMPIMTGVQFIEDQLSNGCKVQNIALMSGNWSKTERERAEEIGCQVFSKPFGIREFTRWLDECEERISPVRQLLELA